MTDIDLDPVAPAAEPPPRRFAGVVPWLVSGGMHATALLILATIVTIARQEPDLETPPVHVTIIPDKPPRPPETTRKPITLVQPKIDLALVDSKSEVEAPINPTTVAVDTPESESATDLPSALPQGRPEAVSSNELGGPGAFMSIGTNGPSGGMFGGRNPGGRKRGTNLNGGTKASESAVEAALRWFRRHQSPDGRWDAERYFQNCAEAGKCEPGSLMGRSAAEVDTAMTGYAVLCFLGAGYDHRSANQYRSTVQKGIDWLVSVQKPDGSFGERNYEHAIATMALAEAYAMSSDPGLRAPAQKGVDIILKRQNQDPQAAGGSDGPGLGWDYVHPTGRNDASVTGWNLMALKSAHAGGLNVRQGMTGAKRWLQLAWQANNDGKAGRADWQRLGSQDETAFSYTWPTGATGFDDKAFGHRNMAPVGLACAAFLGHRQNDPLLDTLANWVGRHQVPTSYPCNTYYLYYNTMGMFQVNGERWKVWNGSVRDLLVGAQRRDEGCLRGSWDWQGTQFHGSEIGRVLSTAYCTLSLEVYYRIALVTEDRKS